MQKLLDQYPMPIIILCIVKIMYLYTQGHIYMLRAQILNTSLRRKMSKIILNPHTRKELKALLNILDKAICGKRVCKSNDYSSIAIHFSNVIILITKC